MANDCHKLKWSTRNCRCSEVRTKLWRVPFGYFTKVTLASPGRLWFTQSPVIQKFCITQFLSLRISKLELLRCALTSVWEFRGTSTGEATVAWLHHLTIAEFGNGLLCCQSSGGTQCLEREKNLGSRHCQVGRLQNCLTNRFSLTNFACLAASGLESKLWIEWVLPEKLRF